MSEQQNITDYLLQFCKEIENEVSNDDSSNNPQNSILARTGTSDMEQDKQQHQDEMSPNKANKSIPYEASDSEGDHHEKIQRNLNVEAIWPLDADQESETTTENTGNIENEVPTFISSENPNAIKPDPDQAQNQWGSVDCGSLPSTSVEINDTKNSAPVSNKPWDIDALADELEVDELFDKNIMKENELSDDEMSDNLTDNPQEMLDPYFEQQTYVIKDQTDNKGLYTIKINQLTSLSVSPRCLEEQNMVIAIYHSHPDFVSNTISGISNEVVGDHPSPNETPFVIANNEKVWYRDLNIPHMNIKLKAAMVTLTKAKSLYIKFLLMSTDKKNQGQLKDAKEWHLLVIPVSKTRAETIKTSNEATSLSERECIPVSILRIQVKTEVRKNQKLQKQNRGVEIEWPLNQSAKRQRLEMEYFQKKRSKLAKMSDEDLKQKVAKMQ